MRAALAESPEAGADAWDARWRAATTAMFEEKVGPAAADAYRSADTPEPRLGLLSPVAREQGRWTGRVLAWFASWNAWAWQPADGRPVNAIYLAGLFAVGFVVALVRGIVLNLAGYWAAAATIKAGVRIRRAVHTHSYRLSAVAIDPDAQAEAGRLIAVRVEQIQDGFFAWMTQAFRWPVMIAGVLALLLVANVWLTLGLILGGLLVWLVAGQAAAWYRQDARLAARRADARLALLHESLTMTQLVKGYLMERYAQTRLERTLADLSRTDWRKRRGNAISGQALLTVVTLAGLGLLFLAGLVVLGGQMTVAGLVVKAVGLAALIYAVNRWIAANQRIAKARSAAANLYEFLDRRGDAGQGLDAEFLQPLSKSLDFVGVSLRETGTGRMLLENVSLTIPAGTKSAVVYADPTEAQSLAFLIVRFLDPTAGEVKVDGKNIRWVTYESLRTQVGLVLENALTFSDTVMTNIGCGEPGFTLPQIIEAAKKVHAHQFVQNLPYGYETPLGDGGTALTIGQRFRIALARAVLRDPSILVIEEPSEPMDADSTALVDDAIARLQEGRTLIVLARRPRTIRSADQVFVLQNGKVVASGRHEELIAGNNQLYRLLHFKHSLTTAESA